MEQSAMTGIQMIEAERVRQVQVEGWTAEHDDLHDSGELAAAAECYVSLAADQEANMSRIEAVPVQWPFENKWWKPGDQLRNLARAGALIAAEIDRIQRVKERTHGDRSDSR
jgi:hypothetical protein